MRRKNLWQKLMMLTMCSTLVFVTPVVHAADARKLVQEKQESTNARLITPTVSCNQTVLNGRDPLTLSFNLAYANEISGLAIDIAVDGSSELGYRLSEEDGYYTVDYETETVTVNSSAVYGYVKEHFGSYGSLKGVKVAIGVEFDNNYLRPFLGGILDVEDFTDSSQTAPTVSCDQTIFNGKDDVTLHFDSGSANEITGLVIWEKDLTGKFGPLRNFGSAVPYTVDYEAGTVVVNSKALYESLKGVIHMADPTLNGFEFGLGLEFDEDFDGSPLGGILTINTKDDGQTEPDGNGGETKPDGNGGETKPDGNGGETKPDGNGGETKPDGNGGETKPDGNGGETKPDGNNGGETKPDGNGGETKPDGNGGETKPDENGGETKPDGNGGETKPDGNGGETKPDGNNGGETKPDENNGGQTTPNTGANSQTQKPTLKPALPGTTQVRPQVITPVENTNKNPQTGDVAGFAGVIGTGFGSLGVATLTLLRKYRKNK